LKRALRYRPLALWLAGSAALFGALGASCDECEPAGAAWCEGDHLLQCRHEQHGGDRIKVSDCTQDDLVCSANSHGAGCTRKAPPCAERECEDAE
jgi:hypothetical protein